MHKIFIWGIGPDFRKLWAHYRLSEELGEISILGFIDRARIGESLFGKPIISIEETINYEYDYIAISSGYNYDMYENAVRIGLMDEKLIDGHIYMQDVLPCDYEFVDRQKGHEDLLVVVAGYRRLVWEAVFGRIERFLPKNIDVCVVVPGKQDKELQELCRKNEWSYLSTISNQLALAQNLAIRHHLNAKFIYKLDEDIFITKNYFQNMKETYFKVKDLGQYNIGFIAPLINVNGYSYLKLLQIKDKVKEYEHKFGEATQGWQMVKAHFDPEAAAYLWDITFPMDQTAEEVANLDFSVCPHRFSIGAIFLTRGFWGKIGGFKIAPLEGELGFEEKELCVFCAKWAYAIICAENVFVGHHGFGKQRTVMDEYYRIHREQFL